MKNVFKNIFKGFLRLIIPGISFVIFYLMYIGLSDEYRYVSTIMKPHLDTQMLISVGFMAMSVLFAVLFLSLPYESKDKKGDK